MKYRPEIDGLRAVAVIPVMLFHFDIPIFSGGFVGVDVFFVISGYLITNIILSELEQGKFSLIHFYERRARRLLPALFAVLVFCILVSWWLLLPSPMLQFSKSLIATSTFLSNILFWRESGYFSSSSEEKPLLHTWSLSVEEQFYITFPIFLICVFLIRKDRLLFTLLFISIASLAFAEWASFYKPIANFFLPFGRAWELLTGSMIAVVLQRNGKTKPRNLLAVLGMAMIYYSMVTFTSETRLPSLYSLVPVIGTSLIIIFIGQDGILFKGLTNKFVLCIGLASYSLYLWHQPIAAFSKIYFPSPIPLPTKGFLFVFVIFISLLSWRYIEIPFRKKQQKQLNPIKALATAFLLLCCFMGIGIAGLQTKGFEFRFSPKHLIFLDTAKPSPFRAKCHFPKDDSALKRTECSYFGETPTIAVVGNSHGTELSYALATLLSNRKLSLKQFTISGCNHLASLEFKQNEVVCQKWHDKVLDELSKQIDIRTVILSYRNEVEINDKNYRSAFVDFINEIISLDKAVILVLQAPLAPKLNVQKILRKNLNKPDNVVEGMRLSDWKQKYRGSSDLIKMLPQEVEIVNPSRIFCSSHQCYTFRHGKALYSDDNHMSIAGAQLVAVEVLKYVK